MSSILSRNEGKEAYILPPGNVLNMQAELFNHGPIVAQIQVYQDFKKYNGQGVYQHTSGAKAVTNHAIKIIGWGEEDGAPYWLIVNSWGKSW